MNQTPIKVMFFCLGNICRSPIAHGVFEHLVQERGLADKFDIDSSGTSGYHTGEAPDPGSQRAVKKLLGADISSQKAQRLSARHLEEFDVLVAMDANNRRDALKIAPQATIHLMRDFDSKGRGQDVPDPWGYGDSHFEDVFDMVHRSCEQLLEHLISEFQLE
ncbi:low molecular weight protein-tyrosine-phosphatase [Microvenator marinus]|nr:low molecular weight protein-tyrosine-phosphatase [Microvenator marinus]